MEMRVAMDSRQEEPLGLEAKVSEWMDAEGELDVGELDSPYGRHVWDTYHLIGDVLRSDDLAIKPADAFSARVFQAIEAEPPILAPHRIRLRPSVRAGLSGLAVAAAVASVAWVGLPYFSGNGVGVSQTTVVAAAGADQNDSRTSASASVDTDLRDYLDAHRQVAGVSPVRQASFDLGSSR
jgi:sigma-E factor negative regulatory protein RseA